MKKEIDYKKLYLQQYKRIPNYYFWGMLSLGGAISTILGMYYLSLSADYSSYLLTAQLVLFGGWVATVALSFLVRWIASVAISQKVVVADALISMSGSASAPAPVGEKNDTIEQSYKKAVELSESKKIPELQKAVELFESLRTTKDVDSEIDLCNEKIRDLITDSSKKKKMIILITSILTGLCVLYWAFQLGVGYNFYGFETIIDIIFAIGIVACPTVGVCRLLYVSKNG